MPRSCCKEFSLPLVSSGVVTMASSDDGGGTVWSLETLNFVNTYTKDVPVDDGPNEPRQVRKTSCVTITPSLTRLCMLVVRVCVRVVFNRFQARYSRV